MASLIDRIADLATGPLINGFGLGVRLMGPFFVMGFYFLLGLHVYSYFTVIIYILKKRLGTEFGLLWVAIGLAIAYNIAYNHFFATFLKPGSPKDLKNIETLRKELKKREGRKGFKNAQVSGHDHTHEYVDDDRFEDVSKDVKKLLRYRSKTISTLEQGWAKKCNACQYIKPIRTHHCSVCNQCVFLMDHHCPWVNNCLGLENYRYFLLFILYLLIGIVYNLITIVSVWNHHSYKQHNSMMSFITILDVALAIVLVGFNGWNWFLALSGMSTIEFWGSNGRAGMQKYDFNFKSIRDNLYKTFGTYNLVAILSPSLRNIPFSGIEWSYQMRDLGFNEKGERQAQDEETVIQQDEEEEKDLSEAKPRNRIDTTLDSLDKEILI